MSSLRPLRLGHHSIVPPPESFEIGLCASKGGMYRHEIIIQYTSGRRPSEVWTKKQLSRLARLSDAGCLADLCGSKPLQRLRDIAAKYGINIADVRRISKDAWKTKMKRAIHTRAETDMNTLLAERGLPVEAERGLKARHYVLKGG